MNERGLTSSPAAQALTEAIIAIYAYSTYMHIRKEKRGHNTYFPEICIMSPFSWIVSRLPRGYPFLAGELERAAVSIRQSIAQGVARDWQCSCLPATATDVISAAFAAADSQNTNVIPAPLAARRNDGTFSMAIRFSRRSSGLMPLFSMAVITSFFPMIRRHPVRSATAG
jgi:hypothetical protein